MANPNPRHVEGPDGTYVNTQNTLQSDAPSFILDREWLKQAFLTPDQNLEQRLDVFDADNRYWSTANNKFTDTTLGGNIGINCRPQFTQYSDIPVRGRLIGRADQVSLSNLDSNYGQGRYYSEAIDDNAQTIYLRFGVPQFNALTRFFGNAFSRNMGTLARTGRAPSAWYDIGQAATVIFGLFAMPAVTCTLLARAAIHAYITKPSSKFYTMKPTMHAYWLTVTGLVNSIAVNKGILPRILNDSKVDQVMDSPYKIDQDFLNNLNAMFPDIINKENGFDVYAIANRAQRVANKLFDDDFNNFNNGTGSNFLGYVAKGNVSKIQKPHGDHSILNTLQRVLKLGYYNSDGIESRLEITPKIDPATGQDNSREALKSFSSFFDAEFQDGSQFAVFKVDHSGPVNSSFSNSAIESELSNKFNSASSAAREAKFSFSGGNMLDGIVSDTIENVLGAVTDFIAGPLDILTFGMSGALGGFLLGSGFVDIPKHWQSSSAQLPRTSYTMQLISPYGNPISQMMDIYIPLAMILAGSLPLSAGKQSYTSPYLVQLFDRGRCQIQLGLIESVSFTHGVSNLPFTNRGQCLAIDVSLSIMDLSSIMHMPVSRGGIFGGTVELDEDSLLLDYLAVLAGQDLYSQMYAFPKAKLNIAKRLSNLNRLTSPAYWSSFLHEETTTSLLAKLIPVGKIIKAVQAPSSIVVPR